MCVTQGRLLFREGQARPDEPCPRLRTCRHSTQTFGGQGHHRLGGCSEARVHLRWRATRSGPAMCSRAKKNQDSDVEEGAEVSECLMGEHWWLNNLSAASIADHWPAPQRWSSLGGRPQQLRRPRLPAHLAPGVDHGKLRVGTAWRGSHHGCESRDPGFVVGPSLLPAGEPATFMVVLAMRSQRATSPSLVDPALASHVLGLCLDSP